MAEELQLTLLGNPTARRDGVPVAGLRPGKPLALLCHLAVTGRPHLRPTLVALLWGDMPEDYAQNNLSKALTHLRHVVGRHLDITRQEIAFDRESPYWLDVEVFERCTSAQADIEELGRAVELYRGDFLEGFHVPHASAFEEWVLVQRARLRELALQALHTLAVYHTRRGAAGHAAGIDYATRLLALEPWREEAHRQLMLLLARSGQRGAALAQYETCREILAKELGVEPAGETKALCERIRDGQLGKSARVQEIRGQLAAESVAPPSFLAAPLSLPAPNTHFVGRERELADLDEHLEAVLSGRGRIVLISGEAGTGKTTLVQEFAQRAQSRHAGLIAATGRCDAYTGTGDPYLPFREILGLLTGDVESRWAAGAIDTEEARRLWNLTSSAVGALVDAGTDLIGTFLSASALLDRATAAAPAGAPWLDRLEERLANRQPVRTDLRQADLFEQYAALLVALARRHPVLLAVDDLQWADAGSVNLLFHLGRRLDGCAILIAGSYRPADVAVGRDGEQHPLEPVISELQRQYGRIHVHLRQSEDRPFVEALLDAEPNRLGAGFRETLYQHTRGHPLFTVEMLRGMQERGDLVQDEAGRWVEGSAVDWASLPARVEGAIHGRISRLPRALQEALKVASVEGEESTAEVVARVLGASELEIVGQFSGELDRRHRLVESRSSRQLSPGGSRVSRYRFRHILFQKYAYDGLDDAERAYLHKVVGDALEGLYEGQTEVVAIQLARHYQAAGSTLKAIDYLQQAGERAARSYAFREAIGHLDQALALLETLPDAHERQERELALQLARGNVLVITEGFGATEVKSVYTRARELCEAVSAGDTPQLFPALFGLWVHYFTRAEHQVAQELGEQLLHLAQRVQDPDLMLQSCHALWCSAFSVGKFASAHEHIERGVALYDRQRHRSHASRYGGHDTIVCGLSWSGPTLWCLGYPDQALERSDEALTVAQELAHPVSLALALKWSAALHQLRREAPAVRAQAEAAIALATEHGYPLWAGWAGSLRGWALAQQGQGEAGIAQIRQGLATYQATGATMDRPYMLALLAEALQAVGQIEEGLDLIREALAVAHETGEHYYEAELHRLMGELLLAQSEGTSTLEAEACFDRALELARRQCARSLELRAAVSLGRLWHRQGKRARARHMLAEIYGWFTEGHDTADLREAKALLEERAPEDRQGTCGA